MDKVKEFVLNALGSDIVERAAKTFVQAFIAFWLITDEPFSTQAVGAALAAGVSAVWNFVRQTA